MANLYKSMKVLPICILLTLILFLPASNSSEFYVCDQGIFKMIMSNLANEKEWQEDYDCTEFSNELARRLNDAGFRARRILVRVDCDSGLFDMENCKKFNGKHDIVRVDRVYIEATTGEVIDPLDYKEYGIRS